MTARVDYCRHYVASEAMFKKAMQINRLGSFPELGVLWEHWRQGPEPAMLGGHCQHSRRKSWLAQSSATQPQCWCVSGRAPGDKLCPTLAVMGQTRAALLCPFSVPEHGRNWWAWKMLAVFHHRRGIFLVTLDKLEQCRTSILGGVSFGNLFVSLPIKYVGRNF